MERVIFSAFGFGISLWSTLYYGKHLVDAWANYEVGRLTPVQINYIVEHVKEEDLNNDIAWLEEDESGEDEDVDEEEQ